MKPNDEKVFLMIASASASVSNPKPQPQKQSHQSSKQKPYIANKQQYLYSPQQNSQLQQTQQSTDRLSTQKQQQQQQQQQPQPVPLSGIQQDINRFLIKFKDYLPKVQQTSRSKQLLTRKKYIINWLQDKFQKSKNQVFLFYSGHGDMQNGDWNIDVEVQKDNKNKNKSIKTNPLTLQQILHSWKTKKSSIKSKLIIFMDSCYSGNWCHRLSLIKNMKNVWIFASCDRTQQSIDLPQGGLLSRCLLEPTQNFQNNYDTLLHYQTPVFYSSSAQRYSILLKIHLKLLNSSVQNYSKLKSGEPIDDKFEGIYDSNNMKTGKGTIFYTDGSQYQGYWHQDKKHGKGKYKLINGDIYEGQFKQGKYHGKGIYVLVGGVKYQGEWKQGVLHGNGRLILETGEVQYMEYRNGCRIK